MPTLIEVADHLSMSEGNASNVCRALGIVWKASTLDQIRETYIKDLREKAAGRGGDDQGELTRARTRDALASAKMREVQYFESTGQLVSLDEIEPRLEAWAVQARSEITNAVHKVIADIEGQHEITVDGDMVDGYIRSALDAIGSYPKRVKRESNEDSG